MKNLIFATVILLFSFNSNVEASSNIASRVGGYFYASLSPHGTWIDIGFGTVAWRPTVMVRTWKPYYQGRWIWSDYGWYWDSYEPFGHIVYHYGRWYYDDYYGWIWIPDYEWAPAWVEWRYTDTYIGWAPLSPYGVFSVSIGIHFTRSYSIPYAHWHYVHVNHFCDPYVTNYYVSGNYKYRIHSKTKYRTNYGYYNGRVRNNGIDVGFVEKRTGQKIRQRTIQTYRDPSQTVYSKGRDLERDNVRTFYADRKELEKENFRDIEVKRSDRRTSLDLSRVDLGSTRGLDKEKVRKEMSRDGNRNSTSDVKRTDVNRDRNVENERRISNDNRTGVRENNSGNTNRRNTEIRTRNENEVKRNTNSEIQQRGTERINRNNSEIQQRRNQDVRTNTNNNNTRRPETRVNQTQQKREVDSNRNNNTGRNEVRPERKESKEVKQNTRTIERPTQNSQRESRVETQKRNDERNSNNTRGNSSDSRNRNRTR